MKKVRKNVFRVVIPVMFLMLFAMPREGAKADTAVCKIGDKTYSSLEAAIEDMNGNGAGTITMLADYTIKNCLYVEDADVTFDLAGHKVDCPDSGRFTSLMIFEKATLRLKDSVGGGSYSSGNDYYAMISVYGGTFIMDSGIIKENSNPGTNETGIYMNYGNVIINGGTIQVRFPFQLNGKFGTSTLTINGGRFLGVTNSVIYSDVKTRINGGYFDCSNNDKNYSSSKGLTYCTKSNSKDDIQITGGEFHGNAAGIYWINAFSNGGVTLDTYQKKIIPYGYQLVSMTKANTVATAVEDRGDILTETDVMVRGIQSTLSFDSKGGHKVSAKTITYNSTYGTLPVPTKTGYTFLGWFTKGSGGTKITSNTKVTAISNQTLYAQWKKNKVTVSFQSNGGAKLSVKSKDVAYGEKVGTLPTVVKSKYTFDGWYTKKIGGIKVTASNTSTFTKNTTLYARWKKVSVKQQSIKKIVVKKGKVTLYIKSGEKVKGYQIAYAKNKKFTTGVKQFFVTNTKSTITSFKKGKTYHIRVRAYKYDSGKNKIFGSWSKVKKVNVK